MVLCVYAGGPGSIDGGFLVLVRSTLDNRTSSLLLLLVRGRFAALPTSVWIDLLFTVVVGLPGGLQF